MPDGLKCPWPQDEYICDGGDLNHDVHVKKDWTVVGHYLSVARGWALVSAGAWCIFLKEAWELGEHREWSRLGYWVVVMLMTALAAGAAGAGSARARGERPVRRT